MTKLGFHVASHKRTSVDALLRAGAALVVCVDQDMIAEAQRYGAVVAFRHKPGGLDNPEGIDEASLADMPRIAADWMDRLMPVWRKNPGADYYLPNNEWDIGTVESGHKINEFTLACLKIANANGFKLGILNFSTGCPSDDPAGGNPLTMEQRMNAIMPALIKATHDGHVISLHVHAVDRGDLQKTGEDIALRWRRFLRYCAINGLAPKVIITELSNGVGGVEPNQSHYLEAIRWWDSEAQTGEFRDQLVGGALYGFNVAETLTPAALKIAAVMKMQPIVQPPSPPPPPAIVCFRGTCRGDAWDHVAAQVVAAGGAVELYAP